MRRVTSRAGVMWSVVLALNSVGCAFVKAPRTELSAGPFGSFFRFHDSKDNDIKIAGARYNAKTSEFEIEELTVRNNASDVSVAYGEQIRAQAEYAKAVADSFRALADIMAALPLPWSQPGVQSQRGNDGSAPGPTSPPAVPEADPSGAPKRPAPAPAALPEE